MLLGLMEMLTPPDGQAQLSETSTEVPEVRYMIVFEDEQAGIVILRRVEEAQ